MKACVVTLGCKVNQYESFSILRRLEELGYETTEDDSQECGLYILNTCAVTNEGERKSRQVFHRIEKAHPGSKIVVCGCASQKEPAKFVSETGLVLGTMGKNELFELLEECGAHILEETQFDDRFYPKNVRARAYVKIQDGCNNFCAYCIVPYLRGRSRSRRPESVLAEIRENRETEEIVLTGINLSDYGNGIGSSLAALLTLLSEVDKRIRLGSLEVNVISDELLTAAKGLKKFCPQFHLSLQSGSSKVLAEMNRKYTKEEYLEKVALIRSYFPDAAITTDVIVGFPTETEADFAETLDLCRRAEFFEMHLFQYSKRRGTKAEKLGILPKEIVEARLEKIRILRAELNEKYLASQLGRTLEALAESEEDGTFSGHARNYVKVYAEGMKAGTCSNVKITSLCTGGVKGIILED